MIQNLARLVLSRLLVEPSLPALGDEAETLSRAELISGVLAQCEALTAAGVAADDFVVVLCGRGVRFWTDILAVWTIGAKAICVEPDIAPDHGANVVALTGARFIRHSGVDCPGCFAALAPVSDAAPTQALDARASFAALPFAANDATPELAGIIFTSGTTGLPKAVPLSHRALTLNALATAERLALGRDTRLMIATPYRFISSISHMIVTLLSGSFFFGVERPLMIKDLLGILVEYKITAFGGSPFHLQFLAQAGAARLPDLRWAMSSGDHLRPEVIEAIGKGFPDLTLHVVYGMAELGGRFCHLPPERLADKAGSVGYPINGLEMTIRDESGEEAAAGEIGDIFVTGHLAFGGYFGNPAANAEALTDFGFRTGDKAYRDADGFVYMAGRSDAVFKRSGLKVSTLVTLEALLSLDAVTDAHVGSREDMIEGRVPVAYVALAEEKTPADLLALLRPLIPADHLPKAFVMLDEIPRTGSGKVDRRKLRAAAGEA